uniref:Uncharacterized protein n=1 Tax=Panagrolaimus superbus TaxID=310955 RepID=A0A914YPU8_9BILA
MQAPDKLELKDAYYIATQQGYATPDVIELCSNAVRTLNYRKWILCWLEQLMKNNCSDELLAASELILATLFLRPVTALAEITQRLMDLMLTQNKQNNKINLSNQTCPRIFAWLVVRAQTFLIFAEQIRREKESAKKMLREKSQQNFVMLMTTSSSSITRMEESEENEPPAKKSRIDNNTDDERSNMTATAAEEETPREDSQMASNFNATAANTVTVNEIIASIEKEQSSTIFDDDKDYKIRQDFELDDEPSPIDHSNEWTLSKRIHQINEDAFMNLSNIMQHSISMSVITISISLRRFEKQIKVPVWRPELLFTIHFAQELARVPRSRFWYKLVYVLAKPQFVNI